MKTNSLRCSIAIAGLFAVTSALAESCQNGGGGGYPPGPGYPYDNHQPIAPVDPYYNLQPPTSLQNLNGLLSANGSSTRATAAPTARISIVSAEPKLNPTASRPPMATLSLVDDEPASSPETLTAPPVEQIAVEEPEPETIDSKIADLVGTWRAVARRKGGELTTVELQLDDRGWAEFTMPTDDGKPSKTKRRIKLEGQDLKLSGEDDELLLGKLLNFSHRQMVLQRTEGTLTFVRI